MLLPYFPQGLQMTHCQGAGAGRVAGDYTSSPLFLSILVDLNAGTSVWFPEEPSRSG